MFEILVYDQPSPCPYLPGQTARLPLRKPVSVTPTDLDRCLANGDRRLGYFLYHTRCPRCAACEPIRIPVALFQPNRSQRRNFRKGSPLLELRVGEPQVDGVRVELYNRHKEERGLNHDGDPGIDFDGYCNFLVDTCVDTLEFSYWLNDALVAVAISDRGAKSLNAVYCYYDPDYTSLGLGTFNVLSQLAYCRKEGLEYLYLGFYVAGCSHMIYKSGYTPHERLIAGEWTRFDDRTIVDDGRG